jgi:leucyl aminopeptidase
MKTKKIDNLEKFSGTVLIPVFETSAKNLIPIKFDDVEVSSKVFYGKKDSHYLIEKNDNTFIFIGLGKAIDYKSLKTIFRRIAFKEKETFAKSVALSLPSEFTDEQVEAAISGLLLGTYSLGHFKKRKSTHF